VVLLLVPIAGLSCGTEISFFFFFPAAFAFPLAAFFVVGLEMAGGGVVSHAGSAGYSMESGSGWFEPLPDLTEFPDPKVPDPKVTEALRLGGKCIILGPTGTMLLSQGGATFVFLFFGGPFSASIAAMSSGSPSLHLY